jgi:mono/diheme cytochrome c family protein
MAEADSKDPKRKGSTMKSLLVVVIALLLLVGAIGAVLKFGNGPTTQPNTVAGLGDPVAGRQVALRPSVSCVTCHSDDGSRITAPTFKGLWGSVIAYDDGSSVLMDDKAIRWTLQHPNEKIVDGYEPRMPNDIDTKLSEEDRVNLLAYLRSIGKGKS